MASGSLKFYTERMVPDLECTLRKTMALFGATQVQAICHRNAPSLALEAFNRIRREGLPVITTGSPDETASKFIPGPVSIEAAAGLFDPRGTLDVQFSHGILGRSLFRSINIMIDESVRGIFAPHMPSIMFGWHDILDSDDTPGGPFVARPYYELALWSRGVARDMKRFRELVFDVPEVRHLKGKLEEIVGPLEQHVSWAV